MMNEETTGIPNIPDIPAKKRVVIIGGGFGGLEVAKHIDDRLYQTVMLDRNTYYQFQPLLYQVASGGLEPGSISYPLRKSFHNKKDFHFRKCTVESILPDRKTILTTEGELSYDYLIIATGAETNYFGNEALHQSTYSLKSISEALLLRNRILLTFEETVNCDNRNRQKEIMTFIVVGGGATGVELAGALADMKNTVLPRDYPEIDFSAMELHLVDGSSRLLSSMSEQASAEASTILQSRGVAVHQGVMVTSYENNIVSFSDGTGMYSTNVFWVAGVKPVSIKGLDASSYERGFSVIDDYCRVRGYDDIFAIGDGALLVTEDYPKGHPQVAQVAMQMGRTVVKNLNSLAASPPQELHPFKYRDKGSMATIGRNAAVADIGKLRFSGWFAWMLWLFIHILFIIGLKNKLFVLINWTWSYFRYDSSLRLLIYPKRSPIYRDDDTIQ